MTSLCRSGKGGAEEVAAERVLQAPASRQVRVLAVVLMVLILALIASALATAAPNSAS